MFCCSQTWTTCGSSRDSPIQGWVVNRVLRTQTQWRLQGWNWDWSPSEFAWSTVRRIHWFSSRFSWIQWLFRCSSLSFQKSSTLTFDGDPLLFRFYPSGVQGIRSFIEKLGKYLKKIVLSFILNIKQTNIQLAKKSFLTKGEMYYHLSRASVSPLLKERKENSFNQ